VRWWVWMPAAAVVEVGASFLSLVLILSSTDEVTLVAGGGDPWATAAHEWPSAVAALVANVVAVAVAFPVVRQRSLTRGSAALVGAGLAVGGHVLFLPVYVVGALTMGAVHSGSVEGRSGNWGVEVTRVGAYVLEPVTALVFFGWMTVPLGALGGWIAWRNGAPSAPAAVADEASVLG
jgi:hypothetical protein